MTLPSLPLIVARPRPHPVRRGRLATLLVLAAAGCGTTEPEVTDAPIAGIWRSSGTGAAETTLRLAPGGSVTLVEAALDVETCSARSGTWSRSGERLTLDLVAAAGAAAEERSYDVRVFPDSLVLERGAGRTSFRPASRVPDCVEYGFGTWTGTLRARVDSVEHDFGDVTVRAAITSGALEITSRARLCPTCAPGPVELLLVLDASPGDLVTGTYTVENVPGATRTFYALHDTHPADSTFPGFDTSRLSPPGTFQLTAIAVDRVVGTFSFRANPTADGLNAPDGRTTVLVTEGVVELEYR